MCSTELGVGVSSSDQSHEHLSGGIPMRALLILILALSADLSLASIAQASSVPAPPVTVTTHGDRSETIFSLGLRFSFGSRSPSIVGSVRHLNTDKDNDVKGVLGELAFPIGDTFKLPTARVMGVYGGIDVQGMAGAGFDFAGRKLIGGLGVQGPFSEAGVNIGIDGSFDPYIGANSFRRAKSRKTFTSIDPR
jgi:hypothetical protein